ncbi:MAG: M23 family metallopeptidase, partial [Steroidobacteraceae bacterium]
VTRGETLALMGSTGRSTGPHVHFEVLRNGRQVNPLSFIGR